MAKVFRIRKLTPRECFRLMGLKDSDIDKIQEAGISGSQQYKMAGKRRLMAGITGFKEVSVCEDVQGHQDYWEKHINANPDDCCNLKIK